MAKVRLVGPRRRLDSVLEELHKLELVQLADAAEEPYRLAPLPEDARRLSRANELRFLVAELEALLDLLGAHRNGAHRAAPERGDLVPGEADTVRVRAELEEVAPRVEELRGRIEHLEDERVVLPRYLEPLKNLLPLVPELADLEEHDLDVLRLDTIVLVLNTTDGSVVETLRRELAERIGARFELVHAQIDDGAIGCVLVFSHDDTAAVHELLGKEHVRHAALPEEYENLSLNGTVSAMEGRLRELPEAISAAREELDDLLRPHEGEWRRLLAGLRAELEQLEATVLLGGTRRTFVAVSWVPKNELPRLREELEKRVGSEVVVEELPVNRYDQAAPVLMHNSGAARPFEFLVKFLDLPRPGTLDPTGLMALFLPLMFGVMVADVVYGAVLLALAWWAKRRFREPGAVSDLSSVLLVGSVWSIVFGFVFGEALGNLGKDLLGFDWSLWVYRPEALIPLLVFALALGAAHVTLGLILGIWQGWRERHRGEVMDRLGTLLVITGLFVVAGLVSNFLPGGLLTPAIALAVVGLVLVMTAHGRMSLFMGPLELIGVVGNILSYLRLAAVGLASAYLAIVANEFAKAAPLAIGIIVAAFFHALNLALAAFSPMIQALRLHYVEFFGKFYAGGGRPFVPFGARAEAAGPPVVEAAAVAEPGAPLAAPLLTAGRLANGRGVSGI
jgi:V/A-type H+-transporting ATPase subunit I